MKTKLTDKIMDKMFDYATSAREETMDFAIGNISATYWIKMLYDKKANNFALKMIRESGVKGARIRLRRKYNQIYGKQCW